MILDQFDRETESGVLSLVNLEDGTTHELSQSAGGFASFAFDHDQELLIFTENYDPVTYLGDLVLWDGVEATLLFSELDGFGTPYNNIDAFSILPNGNWLLSTDINAILGGLALGSAKWKLRLRHRPAV